MDTALRFAHFYNNLRGKPEKSILLLGKKAIMVQHLCLLASPAKNVTRASSTPIPIAYIFSGNVNPTSGLRV